VPSGFVVLLLDQRASLLSRLEIGAKDLGARGAHLVADKCLDGFCLVAAALLVVWRIGHSMADTAGARNETRHGPRAGGRVSRSR
jgi:hypothetical protein